jgi:alkanesulfonate monooxygenase SsuD/methylene tetrahydromethanopterin reductase-like flavin-dependent oxidoreductase (luciferase family)
LTLGVGIGDRGRQFEAFGEPGDARIRAERLDEALEVITRLWSGEEVNHHGKHYTVDGYALTALPLQRPRIPVWVGGDSPAAMRRAARWDGWIGPDDDPLSGTPEDVGGVRGAASDGPRRHRVETPLSTLSVMRISVIRPPTAASKLAIVS